MWNEPNADSTVVVNEAALPCASTTSAPGAWTVQDAAELYQISAWSQGYFAIGESGHVTVRPDASPRRELDLYEIVRGLSERGYDAPSVGEIATAMGAPASSAIEELAERIGWERMVLHGYARALQDLARGGRRMARSDGFAN